MLRCWSSCCEAKQWLEKGIAVYWVPESEGRHGNRSDGWGNMHRKNRWQRNSRRREKKVRKLSSQKRVEADERKRKASRQSRQRSGRKEVDKGKHRSSSCGSEAGKDERKQTEGQVLEAREFGWETSRNGRWRTVKPKGRTEALNKPLWGEVRKKRNGRNRSWVVSC